MDSLSRKTPHGLNTMINTQPGILRDLEIMGIEPMLLGYIDDSTRGATFYNRRN